MPKTSTVRRWSHGRVKRMAKRNIKAAVLATATEFDRASYGKGRNMSVLEERGHNHVNALVEQMLSALYEQALDDVRRTEGRALESPSTDEIIRIALARS